MQKNIISEKDSRASGVTMASRPRHNNVAAAPWAPLLAVALFSLVEMAAAQKLPPPFYLPNPNDIYTQITAAGILAGVITIIAGTLMNLFGIRLFRLALFVAGGYFLAILAYTLLYRFEPANGIGYPNVDRYWLYVGVTAGAGIVGGLLFGLIWQLGLTILGAVGGLFLGLFITGLFSNLLPSWGGIVICVVLGIVGIILIWVLKTPIIILSTAIFGAVSVFWGIDFFVHTGFNQMLTVLFKGQFADFNGWSWTWPLIGMIIGCGVMMIVGATLQFCVFKEHPWRPAKNTCNMC